MDDRKVIVVTGASRGIGEAISLRLANKHHVVLIARDVAALERVASKIREAGGTATCHECDVTDEARVKEVSEAILASHRHVDVLVNNAGIGVFGRVDLLASKDFKAMLDVNVLGTFYCTKYMIGSMMERKRGHVINIASVAGLSGFAGGAGYAASKFAVVGFTESLREDVKQHGIAVTAVCPGSVLTRFGGKDPASKAGRDFVLEPSDVAHTVEYLVEQAETANTKLVELKPRRREEFR